MSRKHRWKLDGVERQVNRKLTYLTIFWTLIIRNGCVVHIRANSVTWNPHKMMSVPLQCSALLVREEVQLQLPVLSIFCSLVSVVNILDRMLQGLMQNCNQMHACYLFQQDKHYDLSYDTGDKALQCGRHVDIFKLWLMWRAKVR